MKYCTNLIDHTYVDFSFVYRISSLLETRKTIELPLYTGVVFSSIIESINEKHE